MKDAEVVGIVVHSFGDGDCVRANFTVGDQTCQDIALGI